MPSNFDDVGNFHEKFDLPNTTHDVPGPTNDEDKLIAFRLKFLLEELQEIVEGCGYCVAHVSDPSGSSHLEAVKKPHGSVNHANVFDGLLDLAYVTFGFAHVMGYPWQEGWDEVQRANITKERCGIDHKFVGSTDLCEATVDEFKNGQGDSNSIICGRHKLEHSLRGSAYDVIKPQGWRAPDIAAILRKVGFTI